jgi:hypothetical protein
MTHSESQWQTICDEYLAKVNHVLAGIPADEKQQILDDIEVHLNERYNELSEDEHSWENYQQIITALGPVEDYADLLEAKSAMPKKDINKIVFGIIGAIIIAIIAGFLIAAAAIPMVQQHRQSRRPVVVSTSPETLNNAFDPDAAEISVTFDQPMMNFSWSWVGGGEHYPETTGDPKYDSDRQTCRLPVKLKPGHWYWIGINSEKYVYFQTEKHIPAKPYVILFATADVNGNPTKIPTEYIEEAKRINSK